VRKTFLHDEANQESGRSFAREAPYLAGYFLGGYLRVGLPPTPTPNTLNHRNILRLRLLALIALAKLHVSNRVFSKTGLVCINVRFSNLDPRITHLRE
jgi:hypothetical protein